ncbi:dihydroorotase [bacterium]|nr:MAG: dihydroorotase [bacterium]
MSKYLFKGGHLVDPVQKIDEICDIFVSDDVVEAINPESIPDDAEIIDVSEKFIFPGLVDMHTHAREPGEEYKEDIESASRAAAAGGYTTIVTMANTKPPIDTADRIAFVYERGMLASTWVYPVGAVSKNLAGEQLAELADITQAGAVAFSDDGNPIANSELMRNALTYSAQLDIPILVHEIDPELSAGGQINEGKVSSLTGMRGIPAAAETSMIARDIDLLELTGGKLHIQHISTSGSVELIRTAKSKGLHITCEVTPHHLVLTEDDVLESGFDSNFKMMPPLRSADDVESLRQGLTDGTIDAIATDHAPHALHEKDNPFDLANFGIVGLETALSLVWTKLVMTNVIDKSRLVELMSVNPAKILDIPAGTLKPGSYADITVFDPDIEWTVNPKDFKSKSRNTPFAGWKLSGKVIMTMVTGDIVFNLR